LPGLIASKGIAGAHLCLADEEGSKVETAEKKARADATLVPTWIVMIEGIAAANVKTAGAQVVDELKAAGFVSAVSTSVYLFEHSRCKTPWSAG
jgi:hypothetical protein